MSKSRHYNKSIIDEYEEDRRPRRKNRVDKHKERRIARALKTKNVEQYLQFDESIDLDPLARWGEDEGEHHGR
jgi:hypothetical protein